ncbi:MAG TPA: JAB domain-containing protein [Puia sp.]|nr:JAB domain-containing protein [Puia sp.]
MEKELKELIRSKVAEVELVYKSKVKSSERIQITGSKDSYEVFSALWNDDELELREQFKTIYLNRANKIVGFYEVSSGGITATIADTRLILKAALDVLACSMLLAHNHPSGNLKPSKADEELTQKIKFAAEFHDIKLLDHIILSDEGYYSFADEGML